MFLGVPEGGVREAPPDPRFGEYPLQRRVVAGLLGIPLRSAGTRVPFTGAEVADVPVQGAYEEAELNPLVLSDRPPRKGGGVARAVLAGAVGAATVVGGVVLGLMWRQPGEGGLAGPGAVVVVTAPLEVGDCVVADWPGGARFQGTPLLTEDPSCGGKAPDGQVLAVVPAGTAAEARREGPRKCERLTRAVREKLADVRGFAVIPSPDTFQAAGRRTACLVLGADGPVYGPLDVHRKSGYLFADTANMQRGDCLDVPGNREARLTPCSQPHDEEVLGFTRLGADVTLAEARSQGDAACARDVPPSDYGFDPPSYRAGSWTSQGPWKSGTHYVVCTVRRTDGGTMEPTTRR
ncbi:MAG: serine/threonine protein kinase [Streptomyces sp.]|nr:serine/threonine protein kinase [Streptomyces sp.]NUS79455.1 serine/threonine protein kinase [Streptomyces sp.]